MNIFKKGNGEQFYGPHTRINFGWIKVKKLFKDKITILRAALTFLSWQPKPAKLSMYFTTKIRSFRVLKPQYK